MYCANVNDAPPSPPPPPKKEKDSHKYICWNCKGALKVEENEIERNNIIECLSCKSKCLITKKPKVYLKNDADDVFKIFREGNDAYWNGSLLEDCSYTVIEDIKKWEDGWWSASHDYTAATLPKNGWKGAFHDDIDNEIYESPNEGNI